MLYYWERVKRDKLILAVLILLTAFMISDIFILNYQWPVKFTPVESSFLLTNSEGHIMHKVVFWLLPIYLILTVPSWHSVDNSVGCDKILMTIFEKKRYIKLNIIWSFLNGSLIIFIPLMINLLAAFLINKDGHDSPSYMKPDLLSSMKEESYGLYLEYLHPVMSILLHIIATSLFVGIMGIFICCLSFVFTKRRYLFFLCLALWFVMISGGFSILLGFQPLTECTLIYRAQILLVWSAALLVLSAILYRYKVYADEL